jgi:hypothetical protein
VFAWTADRKSVQMLTRDPKTGEGKFMELKTEDMKPKKTVHFPVMGDKGVKTATIEVIDLHIVP